MLYWRFTRGWQQLTAVHIVDASKCIVIIGNNAFAPVVKRVTLVNL